ncbi:MAG: ester cyclase [Ignavibacteria bacterium]|nr:ester cyclase [Ignavibacteria bacterium]
MSLVSCSDDKDVQTYSQASVDSLRNQITNLTSGNQQIAKNLATFDTLDFTVFSNQDWARLHESHSKDVKVNWPDGHSTVGIDRHIADLKQMFVYAPNTNIQLHPVRFGSGNMTCVTGIMSGTFSSPMPTGKGTMIQSTGKLFSIPMCTVAMWKNGVIIEEHLFWDNQAYMNQIGLGK